MSSSTFSAPANLKPCPNKPNCVSSKATDEHAISPFSLINGSTVDMAQLVKLIVDFDARASVIQDGMRIHAEFTSRIFGFVDDLDLIIDSQQNTVHVRSASRAGHYDFGVNRRRVEKLRAHLKKTNLIK